MMVLGAALLAFLAPVTLIIGLWWVYTSGERVRRRLTRHLEARGPERELLRSDLAENRSVWERLARKSDLVGQLAGLARQAGSRRSVTDLLLIIGALGGLGGVVGGWRTGSGG